MLGLLLQEVGCVHISSMPHILDFSSGTPLHESQHQNYMIWPLMLKTSLLTTLPITGEEFDQTYQQMLSEIQMSQFRGLWSLLTVWGVKGE